MPEGADSLSQYYEMVSYAIRRLHENIYNGSSPGYVPTSYPQLAKYIDVLARNVSEEVNLKVLKGSAIVVDAYWKWLTICAGIRVLWDLIACAIMGDWSWKTFILNAAGMFMSLCIGSILAAKCIPRR